MSRYRVPLLKDDGTWHDPRSESTPVKVKVGKHVDLSVLNQLSEVKLNKRGRRDSNQVRHINDALNKCLAASKAIPP